MSSNQRDFENNQDQSRQLDIDECKQLFGNNSFVKQTNFDSFDVSKGTLVRNKAEVFIQADDHKTDLESSQNINLISSKKQNEQMSDLEISQQRQMIPKKQKPQLSQFDQNLILNNNIQVKLSKNEENSKETQKYQAISSSQQQNDHVDYSQDQKQSSIQRQPQTESTFRKKQQLSGNQLNKQIKGLGLAEASQSIIKQKKSLFVKKEPQDSIVLLSFRFVNFFLQKTYSGRTKQLSDKVREKISDKSDYIQGKVKKLFLYKWIDKMGIKIKNLFDKIKIPLFNPEQKWRIYFNSMIVIFNCFYLYVISLNISFSNGQISSWSKALQQIAQVVWIADMIIQMNTAMYHDNEFTEDRRTIMKIFLKEYFFFEVLPIIFENLHSSNIYISILFHLPLLLKIKGIMIMLDNLEFYILQMLENHSIFQLFKLIMKMLLFGHFLACCKNVVISYELVSNEVFIWSYSISDYHENDKITNYLKCMYWAFTVMLNVSHPIPSTQLELIFTSFCMIISSIAFGYILSAIGSILSKLSKNSEDFNRDLNILNQYMKRKRIEIGLKRRANISLKKYYEQQLRTKIAEERATLQKVDNRMFRELLVSSNQRILKYCPFFAHIFTESTLEQICMSLEEVYYTPQETIIDNDGKKSEKYLYMVIEGKVKVCENYERIQVGSSTQSENQIQLQQRLLGKLVDLSKFKKQQSTNQYNGSVLQKGDFFGLIGFILDRQSIQKAQSLEYSTILRISRIEMERIISTNTKDKETFLELRDKLLYGNDISGLFIECAFCKSKQHLSQDCYLLHFDRNDKMIHFRNNYSQYQVRQKLENRKKQKYFNSLKVHRYIIENIEELRSNYGLESSRKQNESEFNNQDGSFEILNNNNKGNKKLSSEDINEEGQQISMQNEEKIESGKETISCFESEGQQSAEDIGIDNSQQKPNKKKKSKIMKIEKIEKLKQQISLKDNIFPKQFQEESGLSKHKIYSFNEFKFEDAHQLPNQSQIVGQTEILKQSQQSLYNLRLNDMSVSSYLQLQPYQQPTQRIRTKSLITERDEELISYDHLEDEIISRKGIHRMHSDLYQKPHGIYFQEVHQDKSPSSSSQFNIQRIPTLETIIKKQQANAIHIQGVTNKQKQYVYNSQGERQSTLNSSQIQRKKTSLQNSQSINLNTSSLQPTSGKEIRTNLGSKKDILHKQKSKMKRQTTQQSSQSYNKIDQDLKHFMSNQFPLEEENEENLAIFSEKESHKPQQQQQRQSNQDKLFYWYFDKMQIFQHYFWNYNSTSQIKKYNDYQQQKKAKLKLKGAPSTIKKDRVQNN